MSENELRREVSLAFYDLLYAQDLLHIYARQDSIYKNFNRVAEAKLRTGETGRLEKMNAIRLKQENDIKSDIAQRDFSHCPITVDEVAQHRYAGGTSCHSDK